MKHMRLFDLERCCRRWQHPFPDVPTTVWLDRRLPDLDDSCDYYAVEALKRGPGAAFAGCEARCRVETVRWADESWASAEGLLVIRED